MNTRTTETGMIRVYVAGKFNDTNVLSVAQNVRMGHKAAIHLLRLGFAVFDPWLDLHWALIADLPIETFKANSMAWLEGSHAILMLPSSLRSGGAMAEMERAKELNIPVFWSVTDLLKWRGTDEKTSTNDDLDFDLDEFCASTDAAPASDVARGPHRNTTESDADWVARTGIPGAAARLAKLAESIHGTRGRGEMAESDAEPSRPIGRHGDPTSL
jgi:hypothetical protein